MGQRYIEFKQLKDEGEADGYDNAIRVYGGYNCAVLQLRGVGPITWKGKPRRMIATANYLDRKEVRALIEKLQEIEKTLSE